MICTNCGHQNSNDMKFCTMCRAPLNQRTCSNGHVIPEGLEECPYCPRLQKPATIMEPSLQAPAPPPAPPAGVRRTVMATPEQLQQPPPPAPQGHYAPPTPPVGRVQGTVFRPPGSDVAPTPASPALGGQPQSVVPVAPVAQQPILVGFLVSFSADKSGQFWPLRHGRTRIGRQPGNEIILEMPDVSSEHAILTARLAQNGLRIWIEDRSSNGTSVNGEEIFNERPNLAHNDVIRIGSMELRLLLVG